MKKRCLSKKSQAAMEFLMTYGWAILVVLVVVAVLSYSGALDPSAILPDRCMLSAGMICSDFSIESSRVVLILQNNMGGEITVDRIGITNRDGETCYSIAPEEVENGRKATFVVLGCNNGYTGQKFRGDIEITYIKEVLPHILSGSIAGRIEGGNIASSESICQNAENQGLCEGLDIVFGEGYQALCCSEHSLCCR